MEDIFKNTLDIKNWQKYKIEKKVVVKNFEKPKV